MARYETGEIIHHKRQVGSYKYKDCESCNHSNEIEKPVMLEMPYCSICGKIVHDAAQNYCCYCGCEFERED